MKIKFENDFYKICKQILDENKTIKDWAEIESDDMFQSGNYTGGFDSTEMEFCFSTFIKNDELWFQISLEQVSSILKGDLEEIEVRKANY